MDQAVNPRMLHWMHKPKYYAMDSGRLIMTAEPCRAMHAMKFHAEETTGMAFEEMSGFSLSVRLDYSFAAIGDECGLILKSSDLHWAKFCIQNRTDALDLSCGVYGNGYGDRSCRTIGQTIRWMYLRMEFWNGNAVFQYSFNGDRYNDLRWLHFADGHDKVQASIYAISADNAGFDCTFSKMMLRKI